MLFSEPKIPQSYARSPYLITSTIRFSALQRAENSSIVAVQIVDDLVLRVSVLFSEPKIPQLDRRGGGQSRCGGFSALQRAENSSIRLQHLQRHAHPRFQCSSASRKFLNRRCRCGNLVDQRVSVLFSEPKIPQFVIATSGNAILRSRFSALQRAENSSIIKRASQYARPDRFQCSSASRKFLNENDFRISRANGTGFSALQRAENSSIIRATPRGRSASSFQCSSASRKFLNSNKP